MIAAPVSQARGRLTMAQAYANPAVFAKRRRPAKVGEEEIGGRPYRRRPKPATAMPRPGVRSQQVPGSGRPGPASRGYERASGEAR